MDGVSCTTLPDLRSSQDPSLQAEEYKEGSEEEDSSEDDEELYRQQIMDFDISKFDAAALSGSYKTSVALMISVISVLIGTMLMILQVYDRVRDESRAGGF